MLLRTTATALVLALMSLPAAAQDMISAADPEGVAAAVRDAGYRATLESDEGGDPLIESAATGNTFRIWFYGCDDANSNCTGLNFSAGFDLPKGSTPQIIDTFNDTNLLGYGNLNDENDPYLSYFVVTNGGISKEAFESILARWEVAMGDYKAHIGY